MAKKRRGIRTKVLLDAEKIRAARTARGWTIEQAVSEGRGEFDESTYKRAERRIPISVLKAEQILAIYNANWRDFISNEQAQNAKDTATSSTPENNNNTAQTPPRLPIDDDGRIATRADALLKMISMYVDAYSSKHQIRFSINSGSIVAACIDYFTEIARFKSKYPAKDNRAGPYNIAALTCYMLVKYRPVTPVNQAEPLSDDQHSVIQFANELTAIAVSSSISSIAVKGSKIMALIQLLASGASAESFCLAYRLLQPDVDQP
jgi:hypothetical protein